MRCTPIDPCPGPAGAPGPADLSALRTLLLEDEAIQRALYRNMLQVAGGRHVEQGASGGAGLAHLAQAALPFDVVVTDLKMGGMDGIEFMRRAAKWPVRGFILISALAPELLECAANVARGYGVTILGTLPKPFTPAQLRQLLGRLIGPPSPGPAPRQAPAPAAWSRRELAAALDAGQFVPFFQPKLDFASARPAGAEILTRWQHPQLGILAPAHFIEPMENMGLIGRLTETIFRQALAGAGQAHTPDGGMALALNISPRTLQNVGLPERILALVREYGVAPERITIEMTETAIVRHPRAVLATVTRLRMHGFKISIDDFGTGYASLLQLSDIPFTELKIDRAFVSGMPGCRKTRSILESILLLARKLRLHTVAEGIETQDESDILKSLGCRSGQGYLFARPMSFAELARWQAAP
jgi:EAL domain-containing protein (putative c-di-GMP-specific phosphodiesterase class I)/CheY-like chemotaxis protein